MHAPKLPSLIFYAPMLFTGLNHRASQLGIHETFRVINNFFTGFISYLALKIVVVVIMYNRIYLQLLHSILCEVKMCVM